MRILPHVPRFGRYGMVLALLALLAAAVALSTACGDGDDDGRAAAPAEPTEQPADGRDEEADAQGAMREVTVTSSDTLRFEPASITVTAGQPVMLVLDNSDGSTLHDFTVAEMPVKDVHSEGAAHDMGGDDHGDDLDGDMEDMGGQYALHVAADAGGTGTLEFTPTEPGEYEFYCTVDGHADAGMKGTLTVE